MTSTTSSGTLGGRLADRPGPVGALAPGRPFEPEVGAHPRGVLLARQRERGLEGDVPQEDVDLESLLDGLLLEQRPLERLADRPDHVEEDVVDHRAEAICAGHLPADGVPCPPLCAFFPPAAPVGE